MISEKPRQSTNLFDSVAAKATRKAVHPDVVLAICCQSMLLVGRDATIVNMALPTR